MRRTYNRDRYLDRVAQIREHLPDCAFTTDIIVGFPGETDDDFAQTLDRSTRSATTGPSRSSSRPAAGPRPAPAGPGAAPDQEPPDGAARRARSAPGQRARAALRRPTDRCPRRGAEPHRRDADRGRISHNKAVNFEGASGPGSSPAWKSTRRRRPRSAGARRSPAAPRRTPLPTARLSVRFSRGVRSGARATRSLLLWLKADRFGSE